MAALVTTGVVGALAVSAVTTTALAVAAWRVRETPGATPFVGLLVAITVYTAGYLFGTVGAPADRLFWEQLHWVGIAFVPVFYLAFALEYLGREDELGAVVAATSVPSLAMVALVWTNAWHGLVFTEQTVVVFDGLAIARQAFGPAYWAFLVYAYALIAVGSYLLARLAIESEYLHLDQSALLLVGVAVPLTSNALSVFQVPPIPGFDVTPFAFTVTGIAFGNAIFRYRLFELVPATWQIGRESVAGTLDEGLVIVDTDQTVVYTNDAAADVFDVSIERAVGRDVSALVDAGGVVFDSPDALGELELDGHTYEVRSSEVTDRHDRLLGHTLVFNDITERKRRERQLQRQRDQLQLLDRLNAVIRDVNQSLIGADTHEEVVETVVDELTDSDLYDAAWTIDGSLQDAGELPVPDAPRSDGGEVIEAPLPADQSPLPVAAADTGASATAVTADAGVTDPDDRSNAEPGLWTTVPLVYGRTVFGVLVLFTTRADAFDERELAVLDELGESIGHAIHAIHTDRVLLADAVVELEFASTDDVLATASAETGSQITVDGLAPAGRGSLVAYCRTESGDSSALPAALESDAAVESVSPVDEKVSECRLSGGSLVFPLREYGADVASVEAADGRCSVTANVSADADVRRVVERVQADFPDAELAAKRTRDVPAEAASAVRDDLVDELTDRQLETLQAAYRDGYFEWPRDATAEDVADSLDIASATLHSHLRKAQNTLLSELLDDAEPRP